MYLSYIFVYVYTCLFNQYAMVVIYIVLLLFLHLIVCNWYTFMGNNKHIQGQNTMPRHNINIYIQLPVASPILVIHIFVSLCVAEYYSAPKYSTTETVSHCTWARKDVHMTLQSSIYLALIRYILHKYSRTFAICQTYVRSSPDVNLAKRRPLYRNDQLPRYAELAFLRNRPNKFGVIYHIMYRTYRSSCL